MNVSMLDWAKRLMSIWNSGQYPQNLIVAAFKTLLRSLHLSAEEKEMLAAPRRRMIEEEVQEKLQSRKTFLLTCAALTLTAAIIGVCMLTLQETEPLIRLWVWIGVASVILVICALCWNESFRDTMSEISPDVLIFMRYSEAGSFTAMLKELESKNGSEPSVAQSKEDSDKGRLLFSPMIKAAAACILLANLILGVCVPMSASARYESVGQGVRLVDWSNSTSGGTVTIPSEKGGKPVVAIGERAFEGRDDIERVIVPDTVTTIESAAFRDCRNLKEIVLPDSVVTIGAEAFSGCIRLNDFVFPAGVTEIRNQVLANCTRLLSVKLPDGVTKLHAEAFIGCRNLKSVNLPEGITEIPAKAFKSCEMLKSITIPASMKEIGAYAFADCTALETVTFKADMKDGKISEGAFQNCRSLKLEQIPQGVKKISSYAFYGCKAIKTLILPPNLEDHKIGEYTFYNCGLTSIVIPEGITKVSAHAFEDCYSLRKVTVPASMKQIGSSAFRDCTNLKEISLPVGCTTESNSFKGTQTKIEYFSENDSYNVKNGAATLERLGTASVKDGVISRCAFWGCRSLKSAALPQGLKAIQYGTFNDCTNLASVEVPSTLERVGARAFNGCQALMEISLPQGCNVEENAFSQCPAVITYASPETN